MIKIILHGCTGAMGLAVRHSAGEYGAQIVAGVAAEDATPGITFPVFPDISLCDIKADVIIDFSVAEAIGPLVRYSAKHRIPAVICTTGLSPEQESEVISAAKFTAIFRSPNMSLGIGMISDAIRRVSGLLYGSGFDIEIQERHHNKKLDSPSGTAYLLADSVNSGLDAPLRPVYDRSGTRERRQRDELGFSCLRGGTIVGEHSVIFAGKDEVIEFKHTAFSREVFAVGALKAARFIKDKNLGLYSMQSLIDSEEE